MSRDKTIPRTVFFIATILVLCDRGLAQHSVEVKLAPKVPTMAINVGAGTKIDLTVVDERPQKILGHQGPGVTGGVVTTAQSVDRVFHESLQKGFSSLGFSVLTAPEVSTTHLEITVQNLEYWLSANVFVDATAKAVVNHRRQRVFDKTYKTTSKYSKSFYTDARWIEEKINVSLSDLIRQMLEDLELVGTLQSGVPPSPKVGDQVKPEVIPSTEKTLEVAELPAAVRYFYDEKSIRFIVGFVTGAQLDVLTRMVSRHITRHIHSNPSSVVANMPGGESIISANYIYNVAKPDGLTIGAWSGDLALWKEMAAKGRIKFDARRFEWIGGIEDRTSRKRFFFSMPPGTPKERVNLLRSAFLNTLKQQTFLGEAKSNGLHVNPISGDEVEAIVAEFYKQEPGILPK